MYLSLHYNDGSLRLGVIKCNQEGTTSSFRARPLPRGLIPQGPGVLRLADLPLSIQLRVASHIVALSGQASKVYVASAGNQR